MLTLEQVRDWLKIQDPDLKDCIAAGRIDGDKEKYVGIYAREPKGSGQRICIGGVDQTRFQERCMTILIHWTKSQAAADEKASAIWNLFFGLSKTAMGTTPVVMADPGAAPIPVGSDVHGYCEEVIQLKISYERT